MLQVNDILRCDVKPCNMKVCSERCPCS